MMREPEPIAQTKGGKYGVLDASATYPRNFSGGMATVSALFAALESIEASLKSEHARLSSIGKADVAVWLGPNGRWAWIEDVPYPGISRAIEWRDGCSRCGSLDHAVCVAKVGSFTPEPPRAPQLESAPSPQTQPAGGLPFAPVREYVSPEEQEAFDRIGREFPHLVAVARQSTATLTQAYRLAIRNLAEMEAANASR